MLQDSIVPINLLFNRAGKACGLRIRNDFTKPLYKVAPISVVSKNIFTLNSMDDNMMNCPGFI